ncbi:phage adaptor protein [Bartonella sp. F02]|uniref:phage adaptor protein n=1 Tax=Bartonella sp. F02 TaxID=2967262 RepID=UPI0022A9EA7D|nr:hypothetical protein [Bartonella sp. F02]MCZ2328876.1 hypothetical protein [Bartonella sp. F02]
MTVLSLNAQDFDFKMLEQPKNFDHMLTLIQDEIDDTTNEYCIQIQDSILAAIRLCEREPFFFNEKKKTTFKTQRGQTWYGEKDNPLIAGGMDIETMLLKTKATTYTHLFYKSVENVQNEEGDHLSQGTPVCYTVFEQKIGLFPTPQEVNTVQIFYKTPRFVDGKNMQEGDFWCVHAFDLIKARAKYELYKNILKDPEAALVSYNDFQEQLQLLRCETSRRNGQSNILATGF